MRKRVKKSLTILNVLALLLSLFCNGGMFVKAEETPPEKKLTHEKTVTENPDGTYDLRLTVSGAVGSVTEPAKLDVVFVLDVSTSMRRDLDKNNANLQYGYSNERIIKASDAIKTMTESLSANQKIDPRYALVTFGTKAATDGTWYGDKTQFNGKVPTTVEYNNGTNYQDGLIKTKGLLQNTRLNASVAVVFVSDGDPSIYNTKYGTDGKGSGYDSTAMLKAQQEMPALSADFFFTVGVGMAANYSKLEYLTNPQTDGSPAKGMDISLAQGMETKNYAGTDTDNLKKAFDEIEAKITNILCDHVVVTDDLSENVQLVMSAAKPAKLVVSVEDATGNVKYGPSETLAIPATEKNAAVELSAEYKDGQIQLVFPEMYQLEIGWNYVVTAQIEATEQAYENYRSNGNQYPDISDDATGTYAKQSGLYSNDKAEVTYHYKDQNYTEKYPMPVIRLHPGTLVVQKTITGLDGDKETLDILKKTLSFDVELNGNVTNHKLSEDFSYDSETKKYSFSISGLSPNTQYKVTEKGAEAERYEVDMTADHAQGVIGKDENVIAEFTNAYTPSDRILTIIKKVSGNMGDTDKAFLFSLKLTKNEKPVLSDLTYTKNDGTVQQLKAENGKYTFSLKHDDRIALNIPYGCTYTITEPALEAGYEVSVKIDGTDAETAAGKLTADTTVEFTNTKNIAVPTGVVKRGVPFAMMFFLGIVMAAGVFLCNRKWFGI